jgi:hypothetical protein
MSRRRSVKFLLLGVLVTVAAVSAFVLGRTTGGNGVPDAPVETDERELTGRIGDSIRFPSLALYCLSYVEVDRPKLLCERTGERPHYEVIFERERTILVRIGDPGDQKVFPEK